MYIYIYIYVGVWNVRVKWEVEGGLRSPALSNSGPYSPHSGPMLGGW